MKESMGVVGADSTAHAEPHEAPLAIVRGTPLTEVPKDLYIPPDALEIFLETFEGPLDLLLYLIKRQNLDILDIPIAEITRQYVEYVEIVKELRLEIAAEYLVMAAMLAEIKSRMLLPRHPEFEEEEDPRAELVRRLREYERYKQAAEDLDEFPRIGRDLFDVKVEASEIPVIKRHPPVRLQDLIFAVRDVMERAEMFSHHHVQLEPLSVRERMSQILAAVRTQGFTDFTILFTPEEGRRGVVVSLLAILELVRESLIDLVQAKPFGPIHIKALI